MLRSLPLAALFLASGLSFPFPSAAAVVPLLEDVQSDTTGQALLWEEGYGLLAVWGVFDGATVDLHIELVGSGAWIPIPELQVVEADAVALPDSPGMFGDTESLNLPRCRIRARVTGAGPTTQLWAYALTSPGGGGAAFSSVGAYSGTPTAIASLDGDTGCDTEAAADTVECRAGGADVLHLLAVAGAVNHLTVAPSAAGDPPRITAIGSDTDIDVGLAPKGTGAVLFDLAQSDVRVTSDASSVTLSTANGSSNGSLVFDNSKDSLGLLGDTHFAVIDGTINNTTRVSVSDGDSSRGASLTLNGRNVGGFGNWSLTGQPAWVDAAPGDSTITAASALPSATVNQDGGDLVLAAGASASGGGSDGLVRISRGSLQPLRAASVTCASATQGLWIDSDDESLCYCNGTANTALVGAGC